MPPGKYYEAKEVELSAEDLRAMPALHASSADVVAQKPAANGRVAQSKPNHLKSVPKLAFKPHHAAIRYALGATAALAVISVTAAYAWFDSSAATATPSIHWTPLPEPDPQTTEPTEVAPIGPPVRIRNAFDEREVFEFPAGTPLDQARAEVAEILLNRAHKRQAVHQSAD